MSKKEEALKKLEQSVKGMRQRTVAPAVKDALTTFINQDAEFAQAVADGGDFQTCCDKVVEGCGSCLSDLEAFRKAVQYYFPGADVRFEMKINLCASVEKDVDTVEEQPEAPKPEKSMVIDLFDLLG